MNNQTCIDCMSVLLDSTEVSLHLSKHKKYLLVANLGKEVSVRK